ncbi:MAG: hypothetical protein WD972_03235 [Candidatus Andersenbacteria bacterium]
MVKSLYFLAAVLGGTVLTAVLFMASLWPSGLRESGNLETIQGIHYPVHGGKTIILEPLAHFDVWLHEPVLGKRLVVTLQFVPLRTRQLAIGVRDNDFWLSYPRTVFWNSTGEALVADVQTATVVLPLTGALQDKDQSIDVMLFADGETDDSFVATPAHTTTQWEVENLTVEVERAWPTVPQLKDYIKSVLERERPL